MKSDKNIKKKTSTELKGNTQNERKFANHVCDKGLVLKVYNEILQQQKQLDWKWAKDSDISLKTVYK